MSLNSKHQQLKDMIKQQNKLAIAFSGGVDSSLLLYVASEVLESKNILPIIATSSLHTIAETKAAQDLAISFGLDPLVIKIDLLQNKKIANNHLKRCYYCKNLLYSTMQKAALKQNFNVLADGQHSDDNKNYRPGSIAAFELGIWQPLKELDFSKKEIRALSKKLNLPNWQAPARPCMATRFPYDTKLSLKLIDKVIAGEKALAKLGYKDFRLRYHNNLARLEFAENELEQAWQDKKNILSALKKMGFTYICIDLEPFKSGRIDRLIN